MATVPRGGTVKEHGHCGGAVVVGVAFPCVNIPGSNTLPHAPSPLRAEDTEITGQGRSINSLGKYSLERRKRKEETKGNLFLHSFQSCS